MNSLMEAYDFWRDLMDSQADQRTTNWLLVKSPFPTAFICITYVYCVKIVGPRLMENRKPLKLRSVLVLYNILQVLANSWLFYEAGVSGWLNGYSYRCQAIDRSESLVAMRMARGSYCYFLIKFVDMFDTLFFILRKRFDQVTSLHVIHHGIMPFSVWWGVKFMPGGHASFFGFLNSAVHVIMYLYYLLAAMGPTVQKFLWWKKYLTGLQMLQFVAMGVHSFQLLLWNPCNFPMAFVWWIGLHALMFLALFKKFYNRAYSEKRFDYQRTNKKSSIDDGKAERVPKKAAKLKFSLGSSNPLVCRNVSAYEN